MGVNFAVEFYLKDGSRHRYPWARLPEPGPLSEWNMMNRMGVRLERMKADGQWSLTFVHVHRTRTVVPVDREARTHNVRP
jgi:hypothetical protein